MEKKLPETLSQIHQDWAQGKPFKLMFQDEARFGRISDIRRCWAPKPLRPLCQAMLTHQYTYAYSAVDVCTGEIDSLILPHVNTQCMQLFLNEVSARHPDERIVMVIDGAGWHRAHALKAPANIFLLWAAALCARTQPRRARLGRAAREVLPQPGLPKPQCPGTAPDARTPEPGAQPRHSRLHRLLAVDHRGAFGFTCKLEME